MTETNEIYKNYPDVLTVNKVMKISGAGRNSSYDIRGMNTEEYKYALTIKEAAERFGIGQNCLRKLVASHPNEKFLLKIGNRTKIKTRLFEQWLDNITDI